MTTSIQFLRDIRIFAQEYGENIVDIVAQVASVERLPSMGLPPGLAEARANLLEWCEALTGETTFAGGFLELHVVSVISRAMRLAATFAQEDIMAERNRGIMILTNDQWRLVHRAILAGCAGQVPVIRRNGTLRPPKWAVDLIQLTGRLAEVGWGHEECSLKAKAFGEPSKEERKAASELGAVMIARKNAHLAAHPEATAEALCWLKANAKYLEPRPRPEGALSITGRVWVRMSAPYRTPVASDAAVAEQRATEQARSREKVFVRGAHGPVRVDREVAEILRDNREKASAHARNARHGRGMAVA